MNSSLALLTITASLLVAIAATSAKAETLSIPFEFEDVTRNISVPAVSRPFRTRDLPWGLLRAARLRMNAGEEISEENLRAIALRGDGLAAQSYVRILLQRDVEENASDIAFFSAIAIASGRIWSLQDMIAAMRYLDPETEPRQRVNKYITALYAQAWANNNVALHAVIEFNGEGKLFGTLSAATSRRINQAIAGVIDEGGMLREVISLLQLDALTPTQKTRAISQLQQLENSAHLPVRTAALNLQELVNQRGLFEAVPETAAANTAAQVVTPAGLDSHLIEEMEKLLEELDIQ